MLGQKSKRQIRKEEEKRQKEQEQKQKTVRGVSLLVMFFLFLMAIAFFPSFTSILFVLIGVAELQVKPIQDLWGKLLANTPKWMKYVILGAMFLFACVIAPESEASDKIANTEQSEIVAENETQTEEVTEFESEIEDAIDVNSIITEDTESAEVAVPEEPQVISLDKIPVYSGNAYVPVNNNVPYYEESEYVTDSFEFYEQLDSLGRCGVAYANIGLDLMPTEERGSIGSVKPTGWHTIKYDCVDGKYLYNRCHLIGYQLTAENANKQNLITGTRYLNIDGMLPFENMVADYVKETGNHVLYRVTPVFEGDNLVANGVLMEGYSVEDNGEGICYCVFAYNTQPDIYIDYVTGDSSIASNHIETNDTSSNSAGDSSRNGKTGSTDGTGGNVSDNSTAGEYAERNEHLNRSF